MHTIFVSEPLSPPQKLKIPRTYDSPLNLAAFLPTVERRNRERQLALLRKMEKRLALLRKMEENPEQEKKDKSDTQNDQPSKPKKQRKHVLGMYVLDISQALADDPYATWLPWKSTELSSYGPEETILYTLVPGKGELIMFGGIQKDGNVLNCLNCLSNCISNVSNQVSNSLHFITAPRMQI